jgi:hypothetical protein
MDMTKYGYKTIIKRGVPHRYRTWDEDFKDGDTGKTISVKRHRLIKVNNEKVYWAATKR